MKVAKGQRGMTLIEVLITLAIFIVLMGAVIMFEYDVFSYPKNISGSYNVATDAQVLLRVLSKEMAMAITSDNGSYALTEVGTSSIAFFSDIDSDGVTEWVRYYVSGTVLKRGTIEPHGLPAVYDTDDETTKDLLTGVVNGATPVFDYYNSSYDGFTSALVQPVTASDVKLVQINLVLDSDTNNLPGPKTYSTQVNLRNLKSNL